MKPLLPVRHKSRNFFTCDLFDTLPYFKDDMASMEHPIFSLSTKPDIRILHYEYGGNTITIKPTADGLPTVHDKDILLYCTSYLRAAINEGKTPSPYIRFTAYDFFISTNRLISGQYYKNFEMSLNRLRGTTINTNIQTGGVAITKGFGLIDSWEAVKRDQESRAIAVEIKLSDWSYNAILANEVLTISLDYFRLRKPIERRIYELARKHCGNKPFFKIGLDKLHPKIGTTAPIRKLRAQIREIEKTNHLPDYAVSMSEDLVTFTHRDLQPVINADSSGFPYLKPATYEKAQAAAPGWDVYFLEQQWRDWIAKKDPPKRPNAAFVAFCRKRFQRQGRP